MPYNCTFEAYYCQDKNIFLSFIVTAVLLVKTLCWALLFTSLSPPISFKICSSSVIKVGECLELCFGGNDVSFPFCLGLVLLKYTYMELQCWHYTLFIFMEANKQ